MKIFVSYSRRDADVAKQVNEYFEDSEYDVFTDVNDIQIGDDWSDKLEENIANCDIFVLIITHASLRSLEVQKKVLQAQRELYVSSYNSNFISVIDTTTNKNIEDIYVGLGPVFIAG